MDKLKTPSRAVPAALLLAVLTLAACDKPKPRVVPPDPMAAAPPPPAPVAPPKDGISAGLARRSEFPAFYLDRVGAALDPMNKKPAATSGDAPIVLDGFGFDPVAKAPAKGVDLVIDGKAYAAAYGVSRMDVASYFKVPGLVATGYSATLPAGALAKGPHAVAVRVIAADGKGYFESPKIAFTVN